MKWPVGCQPVGETDVGACVWRRDDGTFLSVVVKATFALASDAPLERRPNLPLVREDEHHGGSPARSIRQASEVVPFRPGVDVTFAGHAHAPGGAPVPSFGVRLAFYRGDAALIDRSLLVHGRRARDSQGALGEPEPIDRLPLTYELALAGDANPTGRRQGAEPPQIVDATDPSLPAAGFGAISRYARIRQELLGDTPRKALEGEVIEVARGFDDRFFFAAPEGQRLEAIRAGDWLVLDHLVDGQPRLRSQIPAVVAHAYVGVVDGTVAHRLGMRAGVWTAVPLVADGLHIDGDAGLVHITWRGSVAIVDPTTLPSIRVVGGVAGYGEQLELPTVDGVSAPEGEASAPAAFDTEATVTVSQPTAAAAKPSGSLWTEREALPIPQPLGAGVVTYVDDGGTTLTLDADARRSLVDTPFPLAQPGDGEAEAPPGAPFGEAGDRVKLPQGDMTIATDRTGAMSSDEQAAAKGRALAPFQLAQPGAGKAVAPEGAPYAKVPTVPRRMTTTPSVITATPLALVTLPWQHRPPRDALTVVVKATFVLSPDGSLALDEEPAMVMGDVFRGDNLEASLAYPSDLGLFKPEADVVLVGSAYPPRDAQQQRRGVACEVRFEVGGDDGFRRRVAVLGPRRWEALAATDPEPFDAMPLTWERAWGGPGFDHNPVGTGRETVADEEGVAWLPNLEDPDDLVSAPEAQVDPVCFAPIPAAWRERSRRLGTYGGRWLAERWPYYPDDFRWSHFQCAPPAQRLPYLRGDEPFLITGVHPEVAQLKGRLPGVRPRAFMVLEPDAMGTEGVAYGFEEVVLRLDHVVFDTDAMRVHLAWRGIVEVSDEHAPEIRTFYLTTERVDEAIDQEDAHRRFLAELVELEDVDEPVEPAANDGEAPGPGPAIRAQLEAEGVAPGADPPSPLPPADVETLAASLRAEGTSEEAIARIVAAVEAGAPPARARLEAALAEGAVAGLDLRDADLEGADLTKAPLAGIDLRGAKLAGATLVEADLRGALLANADLTGANLSRAALAGADFTEATLVDAVLDGALVEDLDATGAKADRASFKSAMGADVVLAEASLEEACFDGAMLPTLDAHEARLAKSTWVGAQLTEALFYDASAHLADFTDASLPDALLEGADFTGAIFRRADATGSVWEEATLDDAVFLEARLDEAGMVRASLRRANLRAVSLRQARFKRACLDHAKLVQSDLFEAQLERSSLEEADFTGANLYGAETWEANVKGAVFTDALLGRTKLEGRW